MKNKFYTLLLLLVGITPLLGQSNLLQNIKNNPQEAIELCNKFREFNLKGISANSDEVIKYVSEKNNISLVNAEILSIYVIGLHCPNVI